MKHLVLTQFGTPSESVALHDDPDPTPGPNDALVRMEAAAVNPSDLLMLQGRYRRSSSQLRAAQNQPPSTGMVRPVIYDALSEARNATTFAISEGSASLPSRRVLAFRRRSRRRFWGTGNR
jgi:hypothetical protein